MSNNEYVFFAVSPRGLESQLSSELREMGARNLSPMRSVVKFNGSLELGYRACLWSRIASRILFKISSFEAISSQDLYEKVKALPWSDHMSENFTICVDFSGRNDFITNSQFGALKCKDAIVDYFWEKAKSRPSIDVIKPDLRINIFAERNNFTISIDLAGESLHRRGYKTSRTDAPLKENLAAGILMITGWPRLAKKGTPFLDPMCGSGTLPIEAAMMAGDRAPALGRSYFGFLKWKNFDEKVWNPLLEEAKVRESEGKKNIPPIVGFDYNTRVVEVGVMNVLAARLHGRVKLESRELQAVQAIQSKTVEPAGLLVVNPPYGERIGSIPKLELLYEELGEVMKNAFKGWDCYVFTGNRDLSKKIHLRPVERTILYNGALECRLLHYPIMPD